MTAQSIFPIVLLCFLLAATVYFYWRWIVHPCIKVHRERSASRKAAKSYKRDVRAANGKKCSLCLGEATRLVPGSIPGLFMCADVSLCSSTRANEAVFSASADDQEDF